MKRVGIVHTYPPMKMEQTECSETSACKIQTQKAQNIQNKSKVWNQEGIFRIL